jgi:hypothetical protein
MGRRLMWTRVDTVFASLMLMILGIGVAYSELPSGSGLSGGPATPPANAADAIGQGGAQAISGVLNAVTGALSKSASDKEMQQVANAALAGKPPGSVVLLERQIVESTSNNPSKDSMVDGSSYRISSVTTGGSVEEAQANWAANFQISHGNSVELPNTTLVGTEATYWGKSESGEVIETSSAMGRGFASAITVPISPQNMPSGQGSGGGSFSGGQFTPPMPKDVGVTRVKDGKPSSESSRPPGTWTGPDHPSDVATHTG